MMKPLLWILFVTAVSHAADPTITFSNRPESGVPREAELQPKVDTRSHGTLAGVLRDSVSTIAVRHFSDAWRDQQLVADYLSGLLSDQRTDLHSVQLWSQAVGEPEIECLITFKGHEQGRLLLWGTVGCVRDAAGKWWFVSLYEHYHSKHPKGDRKLATEAPKSK